MVSSAPEASIIIPAKNAAQTIAQTLESIIKFSIHKKTEIIVVIDGNDKPTASIASRYPIKVIQGNGKGPAAARNIGIAHSQGELLIFLDADCIVSSNWYNEHIKAQKLHNGLFAVGGSICMRKNTSLWAMCDHFSSWYNVNPYRKRGWVPNHPPANLSISRKTFNLVGPFQEDLPQKGVHEEAQWQGKLLRMNGRILFEPCASVWHIDRDDFIGYLKHNYWWGYNSLTVKNKTGISRFPFIYKKQTPVLFLFIPFAFAHTYYTILCWLRSGKILPLFFSPLILVGRLIYSIGMVNGKLCNSDDKLKITKK